VVDQAELLKKQSEASHDKPKPHQGKGGANPRKKRSLGGQIVAQVGSLTDIR
jgi:hypothetical protein